MSSLKIDKGFRLVIIGAGPTAIGMLHRIYSLITEGTISEKDIQIIVLEKENKVGGLARSVTDEKGFTWDLGVHVLGVSKYQEFEEVINSAVNKWNKVRRSVKADLTHLFRSDSPCNNYVPYPVQHSIPYFPPSIRQKCINELKDLRSLPTSCSNFAEYSANVFGKTLLDIFIRPYNRKLEEMNAFWALNRVPTIDLSSVELHCGRSQQELEDDLRSSVTCFRYPRDYKGVGKIWEKIAQRYPESIFHFQERVRTIDIKAKKVITEDLNCEMHSYDYNAILSTLPIPELSKISAVISDINLKYSKVILVGVGLKHPQCEWTQLVTWAYFPLPDTIFYRCTFLSNFNDNLTPDSNQFWSVLCEIGLEADANFVEEEMIVKVIEGLKLKGIIADNNEIVDKWLCILPYGYPIPTIDRDKELQRCHEAFQAHNIYSRGRFGGWKYEISNQDHCFMMGMQCADLILFKVKETLYTF
uniref:Amino_oxidase domain-containing protein n=1 Tax=Elaeophora elaphi TaxID=1147741 RepID=A0A0R3S1W1_9BILA